MPITIQTLRKSATRVRPVELAKSLSEARASAQTTAFLCHSHLDQDLARGLQNFLVEQGWSVYIDWQDTNMPSKPDRNTAAIIQRKIVDCTWFLFLATPNSVRSRWCPWEIGYADRAKQVEKIVLIRTSDGGRNYGNEYLGLYREITYRSDGQLAIFPAGQDTNGMLVENLN
ncbi:MAG TPA: toll/interleukin-1 receptor domain-containing protein [Rhizomicrobium sp.]|nr:toll/interleukin-1 receptor domain-containing protein [Rhizomicrobium sp.]